MEVSKEVKVIFVMSIILILILIFLFDISAQNVTSLLNVTIGPPILIKPIPNFSWKPNTTLSNAFNLYDYFINGDGERNLNFSHSYLENITIIIDSDYNVSFVPDFDFFGNRTVTFIASNLLYNTSSNLVYLVVGSDREPPKWYDPKKNKNVIYQSDYVNFTTHWTDNYQLSHYIFSIRQAGVWTNYSDFFSGVENFSTYSVQIIDPEFTVIYWYFCAWDTNDNMNCTDWQTFNVSNKSIPSPPPSKIPPPILGAISGIAGAFVSESVPSKKVKSFSADPYYFKVSIKQGSTETRLLKITNTGNTNLTFNLSVFGLSDYVKLSDTSFSLAGGETKKITVDFSAGINATPEEYFGSIRIDSVESLEIPIILDINLLNLDFFIDVNISDKYKVVRPGNIVKANISMRNLKDNPQNNVTLYYAIKNLNGVLYNSNEESVNLNSFLSLERELVIPNEASEGEYIFYARLSRENSIAIDSDDFFVGVRFRFASLLKTYSIFILIIFLSILALILILKYKDEKRKERLLNLYLILNELKNLIKEGKFDKAVELYIKIKTMYGEPISRNTIKDKEKLKEEMKKFSDKLKEEMEESGLIKNKEEKEDKKESAKEDVEKKDTINENIKEEKKDKKESAKEDVEKKDTINENIKEEKKESLENKKEINEEKSSDNKDKMNLEFISKEKNNAKEINSNENNKKEEIKKEVK
ncbi:MAG: hypothetical protein QXW97_00080 [Candidatus Pacearchaeota archaeon]